jgi:hypothetical protein
MSLTTLLQPTAGKSRVQNAVARLQEAMNELYLEQSERAERQKNFQVKPLSEREKVAIDKAKVRAIKQQHMLSVDRKWFWSFTAEMVDMLRDMAADLRKRGERGQANAIEARVDAVCLELEKIQQRSAP